MPSPTVTITGNLFDLTGSADAATITFTLVNYGNNVPRVSGASILAQTKVSPTVAAGAFSTTIYGNDVISPSSTFYCVQITDEKGFAIAAGNYQFTGTGSYDLSTLAQYNPPAPSTLPPNPVLLNPTGLQTIATYALSVPSLYIQGGTSNAQFTGAFTAPRIYTMPDASGTVFFNGTNVALVPSTAGGTTVGTAALPFSSLFLGGAATNNIRLTGTATGARTFTLPDANSNPVQPLGSATSHKWVQYIDSTGTQNLAQPAAADLSDGTTGSGAVVLASSPALTTPTLGAASATSINKVAITAPATAATLTVANNKTLTANSSLTLAGTDGKTLTVNNSLTLAGTDSTTMTFPTSSDNVVGTAASQTLTNKTLNGVASGNAVNLLNQQAALSPVTPSSGVDTTLYTYTIPAGMLGQGKGLRIKTAFTHSSGSTTSTYKIKLASSTLYSGGGAQTTQGMLELLLFNNSGSQAAQNWLGCMYIDTSFVNNQSGTAAVDMTAQQTIVLAVNVASNTDQYTPKFWLVELIQ